jgi:hypothetical protein
VKAITSTALGAEDFGVNILLNLQTVPAIFLLLRCECDQFAL